MSKRECIDYRQLGEELARFLIRSGPSTARQICQYLEISQPTFSRLLTRLEKKILRAGQGRQTQYALEYFLPTGQTEVPVFAIHEDATSTQVATLHAIQPKGYYLKSASDTILSRFYEGLPYLFEDLRPSGFLGRLVPRLHPDLQLPDNIQNWNDTHCLHYLTRYGWDLAGNYILGEWAFEKYLENFVDPPDVIREDERETAYPRLADRAMSAGIPGSSAAGEHPKFLAFRTSPQGLIPVLVKFSPPGGDAIGRRVADLLVCEHVAHEVLHAHGQVSSQSCLLSGAHRLFLEMKRFDRTSARGRRGLITLHALDAEFVGRLHSWIDTAEALFSQKRVDSETLTKIRWLDTFGRLIGNTDRHHGNISFFIEGEKIAGLAPVYDMLPMMYAPQQNQLVERPFNPAPPKPSEALVWTEALTAARNFWKQIQFHPQISGEFKTLTAENEPRLAKLSEIGPL